MAAVSLRDIVKVYGRDIAVRGIDLDIPDKALVVLVGPSGCGKSTTLRMIAGLESISYGELRVDGRVVNEVPARDRGVAMVFQSYALYPHMNVRQNLEFSLKLAKLPRPEIEKRVSRAVAVLELAPYLERKPAQLSGGQRQRVAMGRAICREPEVFLFDEPLSNLDAKLRNQMRAEIKRLQRRLQVTTIYVTHDQVEAMTLADVIVVMRDGIIEQTGTPLEVFEEPANLFVAGFIGSPQMNFFEGVAEAADGETGLQRRALPAPPGAGPLRPRSRCRGAHRRRIPARGHRARGARHGAPSRACVLLTGRVHGDAGQRDPAVLVHRRRRIHQPHAPAAAGRSRRDPDLPA